MNSINLIAYRDALENSKAMDEISRTLYGKAIDIPKLAKASYEEFKKYHEKILPLKKSREK